MSNILHILTTKDRYTQLSKLLLGRSLDADIVRIINNMGEYYDATKLEEIKWDEFALWWNVRNPLIKPDQQAVYNKIFDNLHSNPLNPSLKDEIVNRYLERYYATDVANDALLIADGSKSGLEHIVQKVDRYLNDTGKVALLGKESVDEDLDSLLKTQVLGTGYSWRLSELNEALGPIRKGNLVVVAARPDAGKTSFLCSEGTFLAQQLAEDKTCLYFTNEEDGKDVKLRVISSALGQPLSQLLTDPVKYNNEYNTLLGGKNKIRVIHKPSLSVDDIEWWLRRENVGLILIDQLRKVKGMDKLEGVNKMEALYNTAREWSKEYAPVITVHQLGGAAEGLDYPEMHHLYESQTAIQGEADGIIMIGRVHNSIPHNQRYLNIVKNKFKTPGNPSMRNGKYEVLLHQDIARFA